jgi:hypothetical protein
MARLAAMVPTTTLATTVHQRPSQMWTVEWKHSRREPLPGGGQSTTVRVAVTAPPTMTNPTAITIAKVAARNTRATLAPAVVVRIVTGYKSNGG